LHQTSQRNNQVSLRDLNTWFGMFNGKRANNIFVASNRDFGSKGLVYMSRETERDFTQFVLSINSWVKDVAYDGVTQTVSILDMEVVKQQFSFNEQFVFKIIACDSEMLCKE
jgi:hypothetical protein